MKKFFIITFDVIIGIILCGGMLLSFISFIKSFSFVDGLLFILITSGFVIWIKDIIKTYQK